MKKHKPNESRTEAKSVANGFGHRITRLGNPNFCGDGVLGNLT
jgi:hypothetical protein